MMDLSRTVADVGGRVLTAIWAVALAAVVSLAVWSQLVPLVVVAGDSMAPAIPRGSVLQPRPVAAAAIRVGDVVTVRAENGVLVTHRVTRLADLPEGRFLQLRGDANASPDPVLVAASRVVGRADFSLPLAGVLLAMLTTPSGLLAVLALFAAGLVGIWLLEDLAGDRAPEPRSAVAPVGEPARAPR